MTGPGLALVVGVPLLVLLEGKRQAWIYGRPRARPNLAGAGLLELQKHLQADRRVDTFVEQVKDQAGETREDASNRAGHRYFRIERGCAAFTPRYQRQAG